MDTIKKIAITTDTNSGMIPHETDGQGIFVLPMPFIIDGEEPLEYVDLSAQTFYEKLISDANISTSQPSVAEVTEFWTEILKEYDEIVHIPTSSELSASCATATALAKDFNGKVFVVDNHRISIALKTSVYDAATLREQGKSAQEIKESLEQSSSDYSVYFSLESMKYLKKGGRISPAAAAIGGILKLRPVLLLNGGALGKFALPRTLAKAKETMISAVINDLSGKFKEYADKGEMKLCIAHANNPNDAALLKSEVEKRIPGVEVIYSDPISLSIACHTGPGTLSLACMRTIKS